MKQLLFLFFLLLGSSAFSQNHNISEGSLFDGEPYLAINPANSEHLVVAWMGYVDINDRIQIKTQTSFDGGDSWSTPIALPHFVEGYTSADPSIDFSAAGDVLICYVDFTGILSNPIQGALLVTKSDDEGLTWSVPVEAVNIDVDAPRRPIDRPWMVIDRSSGPHQGNIYITSMNASGAIAPFHPYVSISTDGGNSFTWKDLDGPDWLSGNIIFQPMPSPDVSADGTLHAIYPSFLISQQLLPQYVLASSSDGGQTFEYKSVLASLGTVTGDFEDAKKGQLCRVNPANSDHIVLVYLDSSNEELDVFMTETMDAGENWSTPVRLNDDPVGNDRMQDLIWADFDLDGDLVVSWRDRRNATGSLFDTATEIWATYRSKDSIAFRPNFQITSETLDHDPILEGSGNDFMSIKIQNDTLHAVWGDPRDGNLNIWYQRMKVDGTLVSVSEISSEERPSIFIYPNPTSSILYVEGEGIETVKIFDIKGQLLTVKKDGGQASTVEIDLITYRSETYVIEVHTLKGIISEKIVKR